jgi:hypothetical protein
MSSSSSTELAPLPTPEEWAVQFGYQLKYLRATLGRDTPEVRAARLEEELRAGLLAIPAPNRDRYLRALAERFPSWEMANVFTYTPQPTMEEIVEAFMKAAPQFTEEQRETVKLRLEALGLVVTKSKAVEGDVLTEVQTKLKLDPKDEIDPQRLGKLFAAFAETMLTLDQLVWNVWRNAAPKSTIRRDPAKGDLRLLVRRSLVGDAEASAQQVQQMLESTRQLIAGLLAGVGSAGQSFAQHFQKRYSPEGISTVVRADGGGSGLFANTEAKCWKKYAELASELTEESIESDVRDSVIKYAESLILGTNR